MTRGLALGHLAPRLSQASPRTAVEGLIKSPQSTPYALSMPWGGCNEGNVSQSNMQGGARPCRGAASSGPMGSPRTWCPTSKSPCSYHEAQQRTSMEIGHRIEPAV